MNRKSFVFVLLAVLMASIVQAEYVYKIVPYNTGVGLPVSDQAYTFDNVTYRNSTYMTFDGLNDNITITNAAALNFTNKGSLSVLAWGLFTPYKLASDYIIVGRGKTNDQEFHLALSRTNMSNFTIYNTAGTRYLQAASTAKAVRSGWYHYAGVYNGTGIYAYLNGARGAGSTAASGNRETEGGAAIRIGGKEVITTGQRPFNGSIDEVKIYNRSMDAWEVKTIMNESVHGKNLGLRIPILTYQRINAQFRKNNYTVSNANFSAQMAYLAANGFTAISYEDYYLWTQGLYRMPEKPVIISFDSGYAGVYVNASPVMSLYGFTGTVSIVSTFAGVYPPTGATYMTYANLNALEAQGWELASGGQNSTALTSLPNAASRALAFSKSKNYIIGNTSITPLLFVYMLDKHNTTIDAECATYYTMCTGVTKDRLDPAFTYYSSDITGGLNRVAIYNDTTLENFKRYVNPDYGLVLEYNLDEANLTTAHSTGLLSNAGTVNGAVWTSSGSNRTLLPGYDWTVTGPTLIAYNPNLEYNWMRIGYHAKTGSEYANEAATLTAEGLSKVIIGIASILTILGLAVLGGLFATKKIDMNVLIVGGLALVGALLMAVVGVIFMMGVTG